MSAANPGLFTLPTLTINNLFGVPILTNNSGTATRRLIPYASVAVTFILDALLQQYMTTRFVCVLSLLQLIFSTYTCTQFPPEGTNPSINLSFTACRRTYADDQAAMYQAAESRLSATHGLDGRACVLRFICELRKNPIQDWTVVGELITLLFT